MKYIKLFENFDNDYSYYLGKYRDNNMDDSDILSVFIYKDNMKSVIEDDEEHEVLDFKMAIDKKDLIFKKNYGFVEVWSKIDPGSHYKNENSVIVKSKEDSFFGGESYRGMILKEEE